MPNLVLAKKSSKPNLNPNPNRNLHPNPNRFQDFSQKLFTPTGIAVMASVGIHGALAVLLPYMGDSSSQKPAPKAVQLVQLSPAEQSRLPQTAPPPALGVNQLQGLSPLSGLSTPYPPLPGLGGLPSDLSPVNPPPNSLANNTKSPTPKASPSTKTEPKTDKTKPQADKNPKSTEKKLTSLQGSFPILAPKKSDIFSSGAGIPGGLRAGLREGDIPAANAPDPAPSAFSNNNQITSPLPPPATGNPMAAPVAPPSQSPGLPQFSNQQQTRGTNSRTPEPLVSPDVIISTRTNNPDPAGTPAQNLTGIKPATGTPPQLPSPQLGKPSGVDGGAGTSYAQQLEGVKTIAITSQGAADIKKHDPIVGSYPPGACASKATGTSYIAATVDNKGTIVSINPAPASNSILDQAAKAAVYERDMEVTDKTVTHLFSVKFNYDPSVCGTAAAPQSTKTQSTPTSQTATPLTSPAPKK